MGLYKRGKVWWLTSDPVNGGRVSTRCKDKKAAQLFEAERERLAADPAYAASHQATVGEWAERVLKMKTATRSDGTADMYRVKLGHVVRIFGEGCPLADITPANVDAFIEQRQSEGSINNTIGKELTALVQLAKLARRAGAYVGDVAALKPVGFSTGYKPRERTVTPTELELLMSKLLPSRAAVLALIVSTSCRASEFPRITPEHVDTAKWLVHIPGTKTEGSDRRIPIAPMMRDLLLRALPDLPCRWPRIGHDLPELCEELGLPPVTPNDLRRTCATWLIAAGAGHEVVSKVLGHRGTQMVYRVYGQATPEALGRLLEAQTAGTPESQSPSDGSECSDVPADATCWFSCWVAPPRVELGCPEGRRILNPLWTCGRAPKRLVFSAIDGGWDPHRQATPDDDGTRFAQQFGPFFAAEDGWRITPWVPVFGGETSL